MSAAGFEFENFEFADEGWSIYENVVVARLVPVSDQPAVVFGRLKGSGRIVGDIFSTGAAWDADA